MPTFMTKSHPITANDVKQKKTSGNWSFFIDSVEVPICVIYANLRDDLMRLA